MLVVTPEVDTSLAQKQWDQFVDKSGKGADKVVGKNKAIEKSLKGIEEASKKTAEAAQKLELKAMVDKAISSLGALKGVWDGLGESVLGVNEAMSKSISHTLDMTQKGAQLGAAFGPIGGIIGGVTGAILDMSAKMKEFSRVAPEAAEKLNEFLGIKPPGEGTIWDTLFGGPALEGARIGLQKFTEAAEDSKGTWYDFSVQGAGAKVVTDNIGEAAVLNKDKVDSFNKSVTEALVNQKQYEPGGALFVGPLKKDGGPAPKTPTGKSGPKKKTQSQLDAEGEVQFLKELNNSKEQARLQEIDDILQFYADIDQIVEDGEKAVADIVNENIKKDNEAREAKAQEVSDNVVEIQKDGFDQIIAQQDAQLAKTMAFYDALKQGAIGTAEVIANALAGQAVDSFNEYLDAVANGEKRTKEQNKRSRVEFLRKTGTMLMTDGTGHIIAGTVKGIAGDPAGFAEALAGAGEVAVGAGMGGIGAIGQRNLGGTQSKVDSSKSSPSSGTTIGGSSGTKVLNPIVINFSSVTPASEREAQDIGNKIKGYIGAADRSGR